MAQITRLDSARPTSRRVSSFAALLSTQQAAVVAGSDVDGIMRAVVDGALNVMPQATGAVLEMREGDEMVYRAASGASAGQEGLRLKLATSLSGRCVLLGEPLVCADSETDDRVDREACRRVGLRSMIVLPIPYRGETVGAFKLYSDQVDAFDREDMLAAQLLAGPIAIGLSRMAEAQAELARQVAEAATASKASFLANMSHEIRTPMNGIIGAGDMLLRTDLTPEQRRFATMIVESGAALLKLLNDILDFSKIEAGQLEVVDEPYELPHVLDQCARLLAPTAEGKGLVLAADLDEALPQFVSGDALRLRQIVLNLLGNAVKFTAEGSVSLKARVGRRRGQADALLISVTDTGIGIPADRVEMIFEQFVQADVSVARRYGGTGLGLSISQRLAELMGGELELESAVGRGTTVTLRLPLRETSTPSPAQIIDLVKPVRPGHVLLVEDVDINRELGVGMLTAMGHSVETANDGAEAIRMFGRDGGRPFDLILMDLNMPGIDGLEATRAIRGMGGRGATIPIVALTASAFPEEIGRCLDAGMNDHLTKPITQALLSQRLSRWLSSTEPKAAPAEATSAATADPKAAFEAGRAALAARLATRKADAAVRLRALMDAPAPLGDASRSEVKTLAHQLAGVCGAFGENALGELARDVDDLARRGDDETRLRHRVDELIAALEA